MSEKSTTQITRNRKIIGFSLPVELANEVIAEAKRRKIRLRALFVELWALYKTKNLS